MLRSILVLFLSCLSACSSVGPELPIHYQDVLPVDKAYLMKGRLIVPVDDERIISKFGKRGGSFHEGIDLKGAEGDSVYAAHNGVVVTSGRPWSGYGKMIVIVGEGLVTVYAHNSANLAEVGDHVEQGDEIAKIGSTGRASGPHLHFEVRLKDKKRLRAVDPEFFYKPRRQTKIK